MYIDLHCHSTESDGILTPKQLIKKAAEQGKVSIISITDHDHFTEKFEYLHKYAESLGVRLIPGVEISSTWISPSGTPHTVHIVALGFNPAAPTIPELLLRNKPNRRPYLMEIFQSLKCQGIDLGELSDFYPDNSDVFYGRMHIAQEMVTRQFVKTTNQAFDLFLGAEGKCYVPCKLTYLPMQEVLQVLSGHAVCVLCHLYYYKLSIDENLALLEDFKTYGGIGLETEYARYTREQRNQLESYGKQFGLVSSCSSDYHGHDPSEHLCHHFPVDKCKDLLDYIDAIRIGKDIK